MKLSNSFTLSEMLRSNTADSLGIEAQFNPPQQIIDNLTELCKNVLQPIRDSLKRPLRVTSGYRSPELNERIRGSKTSQHMKGEAADIELWINGVEKNGILLDEVLNLFFTGKLVFDQLIIEFPDENDIPKWLHISYGKKNRMEVLIARKNSLGKTYYEKVENV